METNNWGRLTEFLFEAGMLKKTPRSGYIFLGSGSESVAEHSFRAMMVAFVLAKLTPAADLNKIIKMVLFHDLAEARTGDLNYVNKRYVKADETQAISDATKDLPFAREIIELTQEFNELETLEAQLASDADQLDLVLELQEHHNLGNPQAQEWLKYSRDRLRTEAGQRLFEEITTADHTNWWFEKRPELWRK